MIVVPAVLVGLAMLLPIAYLVIRGAGATTEAWELLFRVRTLHIIGRTTLLVLVVTGVSILLAVPIAWLTTRSDLPYRRVWSVLTAMPLVVPTFVGAFLFVSVLGPRGVLQQALEPLGVERLPDIYGLPGAALVLTLLSYPYILLTVKSAIPRARSSARRVGADARTRKMEYGVPCDPTAASPRNRLGGAARGTLHAERLRSGVADAIPDVHVGYLPAVPDGVRPEHRWSPVARAGRDGPGDSPARLVHAR